jgi:hypothetical protein
MAAVEEAHAEFAPTTTAIYKTEAPVSVNRA